MLTLTKCFLEVLEDIKAVWLYIYIYIHSQGSIHLEMVAVYSTANILY